MINTPEFLLALSAKTENINCPFCKESKAWTVNNLLTTTIDVQELNYPTGWLNAEIPASEKDEHPKLNIPVVQLLCNNCGYVAHFNPYMTLKK
ncbi:hypothetical protein [Tissierella sp.]|uniref:hypothetical protein n=1 Tax=Tissierella sp. TaxID=41274 RepID=UPI003073315B